MKIAAFDIGGTALKMGVITTEGQFLNKGKIPVARSDGDTILQGILSWLDTHPNCDGIAISAPGYVNPHTGYIEMGGAIRKFDHFAITEWLKVRTSLPVTIENDANCVLLAERWQGKAADLHDFLVMTVGTGIGGAIFCNDQLVRGSRFRAGEFGYMFTERPGTRHATHYSMNATCTMRVLRQRYSDHRGKILETVTGEEIFEGYEAGDVVCKRLVDDFFHGIASGLYNLANLFDPQLILLGGGIVERPGFIQHLRRQLTWFGIDTPVDTVSHGNDAGLLGAVYHFNQRAEC